MIQCHWQDVSAVAWVLNRKRREAHGEAPFFVSLVIIEEQKEEGRWSQITIRYKKKYLNKEAPIFRDTISPRQLNFKKKRPQEEVQMPQCQIQFLSLRTWRILSSEHKGNRPNLLQWIFVSLKMRSVLVFHSSQILSGDLLDSSRLYFIQLAKGQQDKRRESC